MIVCLCVWIHARPFKSYSRHHRSLSLLLISVRFLFLKIPKIPFKENRVHFVLSSVQQSSDLCLVHFSGRVWEMAQNWKREDEWRTKNCRKSCYHVWTRWHMIFICILRRRQSGSKRMENSKIKIMLSFHRCGKAKATAIPKHIGMAEMAEILPEFNIYGLCFSRQIEF